MPATSCRDVGLISQKKEILERVEFIAKEFDISWLHWDSPEALEKDFSPCRLFLFHEREKLEQSALYNKLREFTQNVKLEVGEDIFIIAITQQTLPKDKVSLLRQDGLHYIIEEFDIFETSRLEFLLTQLIRTQYVAIKDVDLIPGEPIIFDLYHLMPLRNKFLRIAKHDSSLSSEKIKKMNAVSEFYIHRSEMSQFSSYTQKGDLETKEGILRHCRAQFLEFFVTYTDLVAVLSDSSETLSFDEGKKLLERCQTLVSEMAKTLIQLGIDDVWDVVNNSSVGDFGSLERTTAIASYVAFFAMKLEYDKLEELILASLIAQIGFVFLSPKITYKIKYQKEKDFNEEEEEIYEKYPIKSLDTALGQRLPIEQEVKDLILLCNERADGKGFPKKLDENSLTKHSQLLGFCQYFDKNTTLRFDQARVSRIEILKHIIIKEIDELQHFTNDFLTDLKKIFVDTETSS